VKPDAADLLISAARKQYNAWATANNVEPLDRDQFKERIGRLGYSTKTVAKGTAVLNLALRDPFAKTPAAAAAVAAEGAAADDDSPF
jgi:hypothetical protein